MGQSQLLPERNLIEKCSAIRHGSFYWFQVRLCFPVTIASRESGKKKVKCKPTKDRVTMGIKFWHTLGVVCCWGSDKKWESKVEIKVSHVPFRPSPIGAPVHRPRPCRTERPLRGKCFTGGRGTTALSNLHLYGVQFGIKGPVAGSYFQSIPWCEGSRWPGREWARLDSLHFHLRGIGEERLPDVDLDKYIPKCTQPQPPQPHLSDSHKREAIVYLSPVDSFRLLWLPEAPLEPGHTRWDANNGSVQHRPASTTVGGRAPGTTPRGPHRHQPTRERVNTTNCVPDCRLPSWENRHHVPPSPPRTGYTRLEPQPRARPGNPPLTPSFLSTTFTLLSHRHTVNPRHVQPLLRLVSRILLIVRSPTCSLRAMSGGPSPAPCNSYHICLQPPWAF